jgi:DNA-binding MarR family transcriptional regulator
MSAPKKTSPSKSKNSDSLTVLWSASTPTVLSGGTVHEFRSLIYDFFTVSNRLEAVRKHLGGLVGLTGPQFSLLMAIFEMQGESGVSVGDIARYLHVNSTFITGESGKLIRKKLVRKIPDAQDRRIARLLLTADGVRALKSLLPNITEMNSVVFGDIGKDEFDILSQLMSGLVDSTRKAIKLIADHGDLLADEAPKKARPAGKGEAIGTSKVRKPPAGKRAKK